jgi:hypothetical protein
MVLIITILSLVACSEEKVESHIVEINKMEPITFTGSIEGASDTKLIGNARKVTALYAEAYKIKTQEELDIINELIFEDVENFGISKISIEQQVGSKKFSSITTEVSNELIIHKNKDTFKYKFDINTFGTKEDGSKVVISKITNLIFNLYKNEEHELKILSIEVIRL